MKNLKTSRVLSVAVASVLVAMTGTSFSQVLFSDNFDVDPTANWTVNKSTGANANDAGSFANFFYDYGTIGIPSAPNSGGTTRGLQLRANVTGNIFSGLSVSPIGQSFLGDYKLTFNLWMNYQGGATGGLGAGGNGTTQAAGAGIGTAGTVSQWAGGVHDSLQFSTTGDGGSTQDYRVYPKGALAAPSTGYYAAGTVSTPTSLDSRNDTVSYYAGLGSKTAPAAQLALYPTEQTGTTRPGAIGFAWRDVEIKKLGNTVTWTIDGLLIATVNTSSLTFGGNNILLQYFDTNANSSTDSDAPALLFGLIDNVTVTQIPEPSTFALALLGGGLFWSLRRRK